MAEVPTYEQMAKNVADKVLDEILYDGKSIREWIKIIAEQEPKTDISKRICDFVAVKEEDGNVRKVPVLNQKIFNQSINDVLDKIRAEIADLDDADYDYEGYYKAVTDALQIIDKYKAKSEDKE